ncbi:diguanylate cyclase [Terriglobus roseus]|uniref:diguanylate cyclase n=1 Tax=Terriglobus roseus TaxID=392734 RepID=A0A1H4R7C7_9BACT|nr:diguanylate cyclase [Terriglobus roseus]SEC27726.1 diguanylate cyclase (GGDEF) domain-containing protein [Terriglobus roseus]
MTTASLSEIPTQDNSPVAPKAATVTYLVALLVIASISLTSHVLTNRIIARQASTALLVNTAGRQRMLSQRITRIAEQSADGTAEHRAAATEIRTLAGRMELAQHQLIYGDTTAGLPPSNSGRLHELYFGPEVHLEQQVTDFVSDSRAFADESSPTLSDEHLQAMVVAATAPLLNGLDAAVAEYQAASEHDIRRLKHMMNTLTGTMLIVLVLEALLIYRPLFKRLTQAISLLMAASTTDFLTGILNRRAFLASSERELANAGRTQMTCCLLMIDLDRFKTINDTYGHPAGDLVLQNFAAVARRSMRSGDILGRLGGEEFALLLPATDLAGGMQAAEKLRVAFAETRVTVGVQTIAATISTGMLCITRGSLADNIAQADALLYKAKNSGRNRVESALSTEPSPAAKGVPVRAQ